MSNDPDWVESVRSVDRSVYENAISFLEDNGFTVEADPEEEFTNTIIEAYHEEFPSVKEVIYVEYGHGQDAFQLYKAKDGEENEAITLGDSFESALKRLMEQEEWVN